MAHLPQIKTFATRTNQGNDGSIGTGTETRFTRTTAVEKFVGLEVEAAERNNYHRGQNIRYTYSEPLARHSLSRVGKIVGVLKGTPVYKVNDWLKYTMTRILFSCCVGSEYTQLRLRKLR